MALLAQLVDDVVVSKFDLQPGRLSIGRHPDNDIMIDDISVSGHHAMIEVVPSEYLEGTLEFFIVDQGSKNGTFVNESPVRERERLVDGDVIRLAWNKFKLIDTGSSQFTSTAHVLQ
ncbi:MAG: FHA domain-containing protein [Pseudomonadota bacterium]|nr:FHA domain-containing protein [Pseudomonadales bacterium]MDY6919389.1 FHA domain-containing protein [Pseudomonadota bacterium]